MLHSEKEAIARGGSGKTPREGGNEALREIAGRLKALSYRDMNTLAGSINALLSDDVLVASVLLTVADELENA